MERSGSQNVDSVIPACCDELIRCSLSPTWAVAVGEQVSVPNEGPADAHREILEGYHGGQVRRRIFLELLAGMRNGVRWKVYS